MNSPGLVIFHSPLSNASDTSRGVPQSLKHRTGARLPEMMDHLMDFAEHYDNLNVDGMLATVPDQPTGAKWTT